MFAAWALGTVLPLMQPAAEPGEVVSWRAPSSTCPQGTEVTRRILELSPDSKSKVVAQGQIVEAKTGGFELELGVTIGEAKTSNTYSDPSCEVLAELAVLSIAIARDPSAMARTAEPEREVHSCWAAAGLRSTKGGPCLALSVGGGLSMGVLPRTTWGAGGSVGLLFARWYGRVGALYHVGRSSEPRDDGASVRVRGTSVALAAGIRVRAGQRFELRPHMSAELVVLSGTGQDIDNARGKRSLSGAFVPGLGAFVGFRRVGIGLRPGLVVSPWRTRYHASSGRLVAETPRVGARVSLVIESRLPIVL